MVLGMDTRFSKTITNKFSLTSGGLCAQNPIWLPPEEVNAKLQLLLRLEPCKMPLIPCFLVQAIQIRVHLCVLQLFSGSEVILKVISVKNGNNFETNQLEKKKGFLTYVCIPWEFIFQILELMTLTIQSEMQYGI